MSEGGQQVQGLCPGTYQLLGVKTVGRSQQRRPRRCSQESRRYCRWRRGPGVQILFQGRGVNCAAELNGASKPSKVGTGKGPVSFATWRSLMTFERSIGVAARRSFPWCQAVTLYVVDFGDVQDIPGDGLGGLDRRGPLGVQQLFTNWDGCISIVQPWHNHNCAISLTLALMISWCLFYISLNLYT